MTRCGCLDAYEFEQHFRLPKGGSLRYYGELWLAALPGRLRLS
jgi:hypothetical protein